MTLNRFLRSIPKVDKKPAAGAPVFGLIMQTKKQEPARVFPKFRYLPK